MRSPSIQAGARAGLLAASILLLASNLRAALTSVGPLVGEIRGEEGISHGVAGLITTVPLLAFAAMSSQAPRLARRYGVEGTLLASMLVLTAGILLRSSGPVAALFGGTVLVGLAIAAGNVLLPGLVKRDFPERTGWMTGLYSGAMGVMAAVAVAAAVPLADRLGLGWRGSLACWAVPAGVAALVWVPLARRQYRAARAAPAGATVPSADGAAPPETAVPDAAEAAPSGAVPGAADGAGAAPSAATDAAGYPLDGGRSGARSLWRSGLAWQVTVFMGLQSLVFYSTIAWLAEILRDRGLSASAAGWLVSVAQFTGLVTSLAAPPLATRWRSQRPHTSASALLSLAGYGGLLVAGRSLLPLWCVLIGLGQGAMFSLALTLFALRAPDARRAAELSGMAQTIGYLLAASGPTVVGLIHDLTGAWTIPLAALTATTVAILVAGLFAGRDTLVATPVVAPAPAPTAARVGPGHPAD